MEQNRQIANDQIAKMEGHVAEAGRAATAMQGVADQMGAWVAEARDANETTCESLDLANRQFLANHPPRLIIHNIMAEKFGMVTKGIDGGPPVGGMPTFQSPGDPLKGTLYVRNVGGGAATITDSYGMVYILTGSLLPMRPPYHGYMGNEFFTNIRIAPGVSVEATFLDGKGITMDHWAGSQYTIFIMGWAEYRDDNKIDRRTAFCRRYERGDGRFVPAENPDYEWEG